MWYHTCFPGYFYASLLASFSKEVTIIVISDAKQDELKQFFSLEKTMSGYHGTARVVVCGHVVVPPRLTTPQPLAHIGDCSHLTCPRPATPRTRSPKRVPAHTPRQHPLMPARRPTTPHLSFLLLLLPHPAAASWTSPSHPPPLLPERAEASAPPTRIETCMWTVYPKCSTQGRSQTASFSPSPLSSLLPFAPICAKRNVGMACPPPAHSHLPHETRVLSSSSYPRPVVLVRCTQPSASPSHPSK